MTDAEAHAEEEEKAERDRQERVRETEKRLGDWTRDPASGRSNSSVEFERLTEAVGQIIRNAAHDLIAGRSDMVAGLILAQLAHNYGLRPPTAAPCVRCNTPWPDGQEKCLVCGQSAVTQAAELQRVARTINEAFRDAQKRKPYTPPAVTDGGEACPRCGAPLQTHLHD